MFYSLVTLIFILPVLAGYGIFFDFLFKKDSGSFSLQLLSGTVFLTVFWTVGAFFLPLSIMVEAISVAIGWILFFWLKAYNSFLEFLKTQPKTFFLILIPALFFTSVSPFNLDHFGYYVPTVQWLNNFGLTKGVANLDLLLGQMSSWHIFQAGFSNFSDPFLRINAVAITIYIIYILEKKVWLHLLFLPILFLFLSSASPDLPAIAFGMIVLNEILSGNRNWRFLFTISAFVFAIKPTMVWAPAAVFILALMETRKNLLPLIPGFAILMLFIVKNCYCFGYPVFPMQFPDLDFPWKPNPYLMKTSSQIAVQKTFDMQYSFSEISRFTKWQFIKNWLFLKGIKGKINIAFLVTTVVLGVFILVKKQRLLTVIFISIIIKSLFVLLFSAQYRFFMDVFFATAALVFDNKMKLKTAIPIFTFGSIALAAAFIFPKIITENFKSFRLGSMIIPWKIENLYEPGSYRLNDYKSFKIGNCKFNVTKGYPLSFDTPQPAISKDFIKKYATAGIFPQQIGTSPKDGYYWKKLSPEEKKELAEIVQKSKIKENFGFKIAKFVLCSH